MDGSTLTVRVVEARDLIAKNANGLSDPYVILQTEGQKMETQYMENTISPVWNETFTFNIRSGQDPLKIVLMDKNFIG
jgi:Ca2+-dependent lipid-binding protein